MILRGIADVAEELALQQHVLRFWEKEFGYLRPVRRNGRRYYRAEDVEVLQGIRTLLHDRGLTLDGLPRTFQERGPAFVRAVGRNEASVNERRSLRICGLSKFPTRRVR
ncbi:MerR family transcriptional regulator [Methylobacterium radiotolerans]|uniref:MerR family transcriptional regulator n=1 Tax=Methylobacterium TaxID=407 RepID=UPI003AF502BF